jgi:hypothetical protein
VPIVANHSFDQAISAVLDLVMERATARAAQHVEELGRAERLEHEGRTA